MMYEHSHKDGLPLTDKQIDELLDGVQKQIESETPEEKAERKNKMDAWLARDPKLAAAVSGLQELFGPPESSGNKEVTASEYWVPMGIPEYLQIALSIVGDKPKTPIEHSNRLEGLLTRLAREYEEDCGEGSVLQTALEIAPDANLMYADSDMKPDTVVELLMVSDHLQLGWMHQIEMGSQDEELQCNCFKSTFSPYI